MSLCRDSTSSAVSGGGNASVGDGDGDGGGEIMLFGVRVKVDAMRKSVSMNNLSEYEPVSNLSDKSGDELQKVAAGYASADDAVPQPPANVSAERKRG